MNSNETQIKTEKEKIKPPTDRPEQVPEQATQNRDGQGDARGYGASIYVRKLTITMKTVIATLLAASMSAYAQEPTESYLISKCKLHSGIAMLISEARVDGIPKNDMVQFFDAKEGDLILSAIKSIYDELPPDPAAVHFRILRSCLIGVQNRLDAMEQASSRR